MTARASCLAEPLPVTCPVCHLRMAPDAHRMFIVDPVDAYFADTRPDRTGPDDWRREADRRDRRWGQFADVAIYPDRDNRIEIRILDAKVAHAKALLAAEASRVVAPRREAVA